MVNHVPNEALAALDEFGRGHLEGRQVRVTQRLRRDLRLVVAPAGDDTAADETATDDTAADGTATDDTQADGTATDDTAADETATTDGTRADETTATHDDSETALCRFLTRHTQRPPTLRDRGSYVQTIVDGVDARLVAWGVEPPSAYEYAGTDDGWHRYDGRLRLP